MVKKSVIELELSDYLRLEAPGDIGVEVAAGGGAGPVCCWESARSCLVGEAEPVLVFIMPMLE